MAQENNGNERVRAQRQKNAERVEILERFVAAGVEIPCFDGVMIDYTVTIGKGTTILPGTILRGETAVGENCVLGPNTLVDNSKIGNNVLLNSTQCYQSTVKDGANIGPFVHIRPNSVVGEQVHLGNFVEVKNSTIDTGTKVSHLTYVGDSDVGKKVNFGCGTVTVNYTGQAKFRTTIKDNAFIGCNTNLIAPVTVGEGAYTAAAGRVRRAGTLTVDLPPQAGAYIVRCEAQSAQGSVISRCDEVFCVYDEAEPMAALLALPRATIERAGGHAVRNVGKIAAYASGCALLSGETGDADGEWINAELRD